MTNKKNEAPSSQPTEHDLRRAIELVSLIRPLKRLDKTVGIGNLAREAGVSLASFEDALNRTNHPREGQHVYFGLKSVRQAVATYDQAQLEGEIEQRTIELAALLTGAGKTLKDVVKVRSTTPAKSSGKLSFRFTADEAETLSTALTLTGKHNVSAQVKACVEAYPRLHAMENDYQLMRHELAALKATIDTLPSLILKLAAT